MVARLALQRDGRPNHFLAIMPEGTVAVWWQPRGTDPPDRRFTIVCGGTIIAGDLETKKAVVAKVAEIWPDIVRRGARAVDLLALLGYVQNGSPNSEQPGACGGHRTAHSRLALARATVLATTARRE